MKSVIAGFATAVMVGVTMIASAIPANAQILLRQNDNSYSQRDRVITSYCDRNPRDRDCRGFYNGGWRDRDYDRFYSSRRSNLDSIASGLFGFGFGAIVGGALANGNNNNNVGRPVYNGGGNYQANVRACYNRYRSYDEETNTYMGYDGVRRQCQL